MSGFVKRERMVNTINPAGGVNPANVPNVGQYGWTNFDSAIVSQLISYVDIATIASTKAIEAADYVQSKTDEADAFATLIVEGLADFEPKYQDSLIKYATLNDMYANMESLHEIVVKYYDDIVKIAAQVHKDSLAAERWYEKTYLLYLDISGELTKQGDWDPETTDIPAAPAQNSVWNVVITSGNSDVKRGDFVWNTGDNLMYTLIEAEFNQVKNTFLNVNLMKTITDMQREISELKEMMNEHVL